MMNKIWCFMILAGLIVSSFNGKITTLSDTILSSSKEAVELCILMFGIVGLWSGLMNIALSLGITTQLQKLLTPFLTFLFPKLKNQKAKEYISTNIVANILGLGWAATPSGLKAMEELKAEWQNESRNEGINKGIELGIDSEKVNSIISMLEFGITREQILTRYTKEDLEKAEAAIANNN